MYYYIYYNYYIIIGVIYMANTEANKSSRTKSKIKYNARNYERLYIQVKTGEKDKIKAFAENNGESINGFINRVIKEAMERDNNQTTTQ